jgi:SAM-dependent methyltransferase
MRQDKIDRQSTFRVKAKDPNYLHLTSLVQDLTASIDKYAKGRLIDIGCGNKPYQSLMKNVTEYIGCDIVQSSLERVDVLCEANKIPLPSESFDTAFSTQTIEHVADHKGLVAESFRLLKKGGHFIVSGPMYWPLHEEPYDFFRFTRHGFKYLLEEAGYTNIEILSNGGRWALTGQVIIQNFKPHRFVRYPLNKFFAWMDKKYRNDVNTMNYVVIGYKP